MCSSRPRPPVAPPRSLWRGTSLAKARPTMSILNRKRFCSSSRASRDAADVLEAVHDVARDENDAAGTRLGGLIADGHLIEVMVLPTRQAPAQHAKSDLRARRRRRFHQREGDGRYPLPRRALNAPH